MPKLSYQFRPSILLCTLVISTFAASIMTSSGCSNDTNEKVISDSTTTNPVVSENTKTGSAKLGAITAKRIIDADKEPQNWLSHGRTYSEQRYSPLDKINDTNAATLGLAWFYDIPIKRGMEATSLVIDGRLYTTSGWSNVYAMDAKTGKELWTFDPKVPREWGRYACCDVVNRGVAAWGDNLYLGTIDGRLIAINAETGKQVWSTLTIDKSKAYTITGAPRVIDGKIIIGNGGAELGVRGYVTAYDANTGEQLWRFYTVPGNPADGFEDDTQKMAAETWKGEWWKAGGGGTVWDSMAYDPELGLLYIGVGNGSPWDRDRRSPDGGDNLFLSSIVALNANTGKYVWHYQTTPGDSWDYTATQSIILADMEIDGTPRKVLMQAPKNGYFYVMDRETGKLISANNYVPVNWSTDIDMATGRPVEVPEARYPDPAKPFLQFPSPFGGHNWHPMSYSPKTGLAYLSAQEIPFVYGKDRDYQYQHGFWNLGADFSLAASPEDPGALKQIGAMIKGRLLAWDPKTNKSAFTIEHPGPWNGGILSTAGNLLFQGNIAGEFVAYRADNGEKLWSMDSQTGVVAGPVSYEVDGEQYISVTVGWGTAFGLIAANKNPVSRVLSFKLGGSAKLPAAMIPQRDIPAPGPSTASKEQIDLGRKIYHQNCFMCHGDGAKSGGLVTDLRASSRRDKVELWNDVVRNGAFAALGMPNFSDVLSEEKTEAVRLYVIERARAAQP
ncbi:MAG: PQQ-dependent dehydrogenase, methanol/ethanol family [Pseudomonadales bacterium]|nr:PQQ-dependent dehydrogenase, methanol/ethanol family [Pseudomonadales bacterium]